MRALRNYCPSLSVHRLLQWLRIGALLVLGAAATCLFALFVHQGLFRFIAWTLPQTRSFFYDLAVFGPYPTANFISFPLPAPTGSYALTNDRCDDGWIFLGTDGKSVTHKGPIILDNNGDLVWMSDGYEIVMNLRVQSYNGKDYLTFWTGHKTYSVGRGRAVMLDSNYDIAHIIEPVGAGLMADLHEFELTKDGTAIISLYNWTTVDLRPMGWGHPKEGWISDCVFQEIDIATGELRFQWRASDYFHAEDSYYWHPLAGYDHTLPFDFYHLNSIEKDSKGNYLISSRHFHHVVYLNGTSGEPLWILGGHPETNQFTDLSDGVATGFQWQHHARWQSEEEGILTILDNGIAGPIHVDAPYSKALLLQLDLHNYTANVLQEYVSLTYAKSAAMGSVDRLPNGNMLVGWGSTAAWSEHSFDGTLLCEWHFAASWSFWFERAKNYRAFKHHGWIGTPSWPPAAKLHSDRRVYVSWNGATEVKYWELQAARKLPGDTSAEGFVKCDELEKRSFETSFPLPERPEDWSFTSLRIAALDKDRNVLSYSNLVHVDAATLGVAPGEQTFTALAGVCVGVTAVIAGLWILRMWSRSRRRWHCDGSVCPDAGDVVGSVAAMPFGWGSRTVLLGREVRYSKLEN